MKAGGLLPEEAPENISRFRSWRFSLLSGHSGTQPPGSARGLRITRRLSLAVQALSFKFSMMAAATGFSSPVEPTIFYFRRAKARWKRLFAASAVVWNSPPASS